MSLNITGAPLEFEAIINTDKLDATINEANKKMSSLGADVGRASLEGLEALRLKIADLGKEIKLNPKIDAAAVSVQIKEIELQLAEATAAGLNTGPIYKSLDNIKKRVAAIDAHIVVTADTKSAMESIETLRAKLLIKQQAIIESTDIEQVAKLNKERCLNGFVASYHIFKAKTKYFCIIFPKIYQAEKNMFNLEHYETAPFFHLFFCINTDDRHFH